MKVQALHGKTHCVFGSKKANVTKEAYIEAMWERFGTATPIVHRVAKKRNSMREAMEFDFLNVQYILDILGGSLVTSVAE